jgi:PAS domain S-box-containing protein
MSRGITDRERAEEQLRHQGEERFRPLVQHASDIIALYEADGTIRYVSPAIKRVLGYDPEERIGASSFEFIHPDDIARAKAAFAAALRRPDVPLTIEVRVRHRDGSWRHMEATGTNLLDDPDVGAIVLNSRDVTEHKRVEEELREANRRLEELAVLKADFTAMIAHEIDAPLAVVRVFTEVLDTGELEPAQRDRALGAIRAEIGVLDALTADLRLAASIERDDFTVSPRRVAVAELLEDAAVYARTFPGDHPLVVEATEERVWADPHRIGQVLRNLLSNAIKHSPDGAPTELRATLMPGAGEAPRRVCIEVVDHGPGVHPDDMTRIFEKFGRGRDQLGRRKPGMGLGLYASRRILRAHGSELELTSTRGAGSMFGFELEVAR